MFFGVLQVFGGISKENSFSSKNAPSRKSQTLRISFRESQTVFLFLQVFFGVMQVFGGISKEHAFSSKNAPSRKSQTLRISFRESQTVFVFLQVFFSGVLQVCGFTNLPFWQLRL